jgi:serine phosphatase RsbU (regulator of sigma subunit)
MVSGDFYWVKSLDKNRLLFSVVDCTGHGVPGAFISMVGYNSLIRAINEFELQQPSKILDKLNELVKEALQQEYTDVKDGMDMALCMVDFEQQTLQYAGANNPLYVVRHQEALPEGSGNGQTRLNGNELRTFASESNSYQLLECPADKQAIGSYDLEEHFTNHQFEMKEGDSIYVFSDGYPDQFGGPNDKKFMYHRFRQTLLDIQDQSMREQQTILNDTFEEWKGDQEQIDDVCIIGVRV